MQLFRADLHIHTVLSPCGDLDMSPRNIVSLAQARKLDIIAVTDHNSTLHGPLIRRLAEPMGITVFFGAEVTTREEAHCLCLFDTEEQRLSFQQYLESKIPQFPNDTKRFGHQVVVNEFDNVLAEVEPLLISAIGAGVSEVEKVVHSLGGLFIPAHVDRPMYSLISQLGFIPPDLQFDALEIFRNTDPQAFLNQHSYLAKPTLIKNSDAHYPDQIGATYTEYLLQSPTLEELAMALHCQNGRRVLE